jgi:hypothetical protein
MRDELATAGCRRGRHAAGRLDNCHAGRQHEAWAYKGKPLYTYRTDAKEGDVTGDGRVSGGGETIGSGPRLLATVDATAWAKQRRFDARYSRYGCNIGGRGWADFAGFHYRVSALHKAKRCPV